MHPPLPPPPGSSALCWPQQYEGNARRSHLLTGQRHESAVYWKSNRSGGYIYILKCVHVAFFSGLLASVYLSWTINRMDRRLLDSSSCRADQFYLIPGPPFAAAVHAVKARVQPTELTCEQLLVWQTVGKACTADTRVNTQRSDCPIGSCSLVERVSHTQNSLV